MFGGLSLCQPMPGAGIDTCWAVPLTVPPSVCGSVTCAPFEPAYTVEKLTLAFLVNYGFEPITAIGNNSDTARGIALDVLSRLSGTRYLNDTYSFCEVDQDLQHWCGYNSGQAFAYCIVAETWPQPDLWGWIQNTTFTAPSITPIYPSFCACPIEGRAYYIPVRSVDYFPHFSIECPIENVLLAAFVVLIVLSFIVFCFVLWDFVILLSNAWHRRNAKNKSNILGRTIYVKLCLIAYFLVTIPDQVLFIYPNGSNTIVNTSKAVLRFLGVLLLLFSFGLAVFAYLSVLIKSSLFGDIKYVSGWIRIFKWGFFLFLAVSLFTALGVTGAFSYFIQYAIEFRGDSLSQLAVAGNNSAVMAKIIMFLLVCTQAILLGVSAVVLIAVTIKLRSQPEDSPALKNLLKRDFGLIMAWLTGWPNLIILATILPIVAFMQTGTILSDWASTYATQMAYLWLIWADFLTELIWAAFIAWSMKTKVTSNPVMNFFNSLRGVQHVVDAPSDASGGGGSSQPSGSSQTSMTTMTDVVAGENSL